MKSHTRTLILFLVAAALAALVSPALVRAGRPPAKSVQGAWISPDWLFQDERPTSEEHVRRRVRDALAQLQRAKINTIFVETFMRGSSITPGVTSDPALRLPVAPRLQWPFQRRGTRIVDTLQIFIDEGFEAGLQVHAWTHLFYWRMDNDGVYPAWQKGASLWDDMLAKWLQDQADALAGNATHGALAPVIRRAAASVATGVDSEALTRILGQAGYDSHGHPLSRLVHELMQAGRPAPPFLLIGSPEDPFPHPERHTLRPVYLDPAHPEVKRRTLALLESLSRSHPDLAGLHLDHVRYPVDAQGIPPAWGPNGREILYLDSQVSVMAARYRQYGQFVEERQKGLTQLVNAVRPRLHRGHVLSAAVLPLYYVERGLGSGRVNGYDYSAQDWYRWDVDFVVPMMYGFDAWRIRTLVQRYQRESEGLRGDRAPAVVPGVSRLGMARAGLLGNDDYVFFDLSLGLDVRYWKANGEDFQWTPRRNL